MLGNRYLKSNKTQKTDQQNLIGGQDLNILKSQKFQSNVDQSCLVGNPICQNQQEQDPVIQNDTRQIKRSIKFPFTAIGLVQAYKEDHQINHLGYGTGCLIDNNLGLTSAHIVYNKQFDLPAKKIIFTLGLSGGRKNSTKYHVKYFFIPSEYKTSGQYERKQYDYALLVLSQEGQTKKIYGAFDLNPYQQDYNIIANEKTSLCGFPDDLNQKLNNKKIKTDVFGAQDKIKKIQQRVLIYSTPSSLGQSGSPIFREREPNKFELLGIHGGKNLKGGFGVKITQQVRKKIYQWGSNIKQDPRPGEQYTITTNQGNILSVQQIKTLVKVLLQNKKLCYQRNSSNAPYDYYREMMQEMNQFEKQIRQINNPFVLMMKGNIEFEKNRNYVKAMKLFLKASTLFSTSNKDQSLFCAQILNDIGIIHKQNRNYQKARQAYNGALQIYKTHYGQNNVFYGVQLNNIACLQQCQNNIKQAKKKFLKVLRIFQIQFGENNIQSVSTIKNLGDIDYKNGLYDQAIQKYNQAKTLSETEFGINSINLCFILNELGSTLYFHKLQQLKKQQGKKLIQRSINIFKTNRILTDERLSRSLYLLGKIQEKEQQYNKGLSRFRQAKQIMEKMYGANNNHEYYEQIKAEIDKLDKLVLSTQTINYLQSRRQMNANI